jgi:hypothetical protein
LTPAQAFGISVLGGKTECQTSDGHRKRDQQSFQAYLLRRIKIMRKSFLEIVFLSTPP